MIASGLISPVKQFEAPKKSLGDLDAEVAARLIAAAADVALIVDEQGVIRDVCVNGEDLSRDGYAMWLGKAWADTVTADSRPKVEALLRGASATGAVRWRQLNHPSPQGADLPILYSAIELRPQGPVVAVGRDLRATAALQQRLVEAQQSMERDYSRLRHMESRYRLLFQLTREAVLIIDTSTQKITEANPAAGRLLGSQGKRLAGRAFPFGFDEHGALVVQELLDAVRVSGSAEEVQAGSADGAGAYRVWASLFRHETSSFFLVRLERPAAADASEPSKSTSRLMEIVERAPDCFVVTSADGTILSANRAFLDLAELATQEQARGESLERWLGRPGVDLGVLLSNLRQHGWVKLFATTLRGEYGSSAEVEISAVAVPDGECPCLGFVIRHVGRRLAADPRTAGKLPQSVEQLTELVGRVSLKDIVRETTDVIERLCMETALQLTAGNRASAAEMLGLSRQGLYVKLRRHGLSDLAPEGGA